jgi:hypothetical protein
MNWVSVKERLPEWGVIVIGYDALGGHICSAELPSPYSKHMCFDDCIGREVTHWTPLVIPELPNEK